jgi:outer membrane protein TolC
MIQVFNLYSIQRSFRTALGIILLLFTTSDSLAQNKDLNYYLNTAIKTSPLLNEYRNQILSAGIDSAILRTVYKTQVSANTSGSYAPVINGYGYDYALSNGRTVNALLTVNKSIIGNRNIKTLIQSINLINDSLKVAGAVSKQDIKRTITAQYITSFADQQQMEFNREVYDLLKKEEGILRKLTRGNVYKQTDYLTFFVTLQQQKLQLRQSAIQFKNDYATLNYIAGIRDTSAVKLDEPKISLEQQATVESSIFYKQFAVDSMRLVNNKRVIDLNYKPKIGVYIDGGYSSSLAAEAYKNFGTSAGFTLSVPIYDAGQRKLQYRKNSIEEKTRSYYKEFFFTQHQQQIAQLTQQYSETQNLFNQINEQIKYTRSLIEVNSKLLITGDVRIADYIIAINNYLNTQNLLRQTNITRLQLVSELNYWNK